MVVFVALPSFVLLACCRAACSPAGCQFRACRVRVVRNATELPWCHCVSCNSLATLGQSSAPRSSTRTLANAVSLRRRSVRRDASEVEETLPRWRQDSSNSSEFWARWRRCSRCTSSPSSPSTHLHLHLCEVTEDV